MEFDVSTVTRDKEELRLFDVPEEIWIKIILCLDPLDILALGRTCRHFTKFAENEEVWRHQWSSLSSQVSWCSFPSVQNLTQLGVHFKDSCRRLWSIISVDGGVYPRCVHCKVRIG